MEPIPVVLHLGPLSVHTYGIGLAITFYVASRYFVYRLSKAGLPTEWVPGFVIAVICSAIVGARAMHVVANWSYYQDHLAQIPAIWQGGLSSFGGLLLAVPVGIVFAHRSCPQIGTLRGLDLVAPVLMAAWAMGRLLGPQLMVAGGGHPSTAWFAMSYAGQDGRRVPVPIIQAMEDATTYGILLLTEKRLRSSRPARLTGTYPAGAVTALAMVLWGVSRWADEKHLLDGGTNLGSRLVEAASLALILGGTILGARCASNWRKALLAVPGPLEALKD